MLKTHKIGAFYEMGKNDINANDQMCYTWAITFKLMCSDSGFTS